MKKIYHIAALPGDGIGPEIMVQAYKIIDVINKSFPIKIVVNEYKVGGIAIDHYGIPLPESTLSGCKKSHAILFGAVGGPKWKHLDINKQPERGALLFLRNYFKLFCNLRPIKLFHNLKKFCSLRTDISMQGFDMLCVRELIGGIYFGQPKGKKGFGLYKYAFDTEIYHYFEIQRIADVAFKLASKRNNKLTSIDKANVLQSSIFWREVVDEVAQNYPNVQLTHLYADNALMQIIKNPSQFDVILCSNFFGDLVSEVCAAIVGSIGILPSASLNEYNFGLYEPAGGSAPDIAGKDIANPIAQILSLALLLRYTFKLENIAKLIELAVIKSLAQGYYTADLISDNKKPIGTDEMGSIIAKMINKEV